MFCREPQESEEGEDTVYWPLLQNLVIEGNRIKELPRLILPNLLRLDLSRNNIDRISDEFEGLDKLTYLDLAMNNLTSMANLRNMPDLEALYLQSNQIRKFNGLEGCTSLEILTLKGNDIIALEEE